MYHWWNTLVADIWTTISLTEQASAAQKTVFLTEGTQMAGLQHRHILSVLGCCMDANNVPVIVYPWVSRGNLKR